MAQNKANLSQPDFDQIIVEEHGGREPIRVFGSAPLKPFQPPEDQRPFGASFADFLKSKGQEEIKL